MTCGNGICDNGVNNSILWQFVNGLNNLTNLNSSAQLSFTNYNSINYTLITNENDRNCPADCGP